MIKNAKRNDLTFFILLLGVLLVHTLYVFVHPFYYDESYYITVPLRLLSGDSLMQHEWHLTEFSSLFTYLPVYIWTAIKGSTEGIFIFTRLVYLSLHTAIAVVIYRFFRKYGKWAIMASLIFFAQMPYRLIAISYQSVFVICLILFSFCLIKIYQKNITRFYIFAGICFGCCCVCNPMLCVVYVLYLPVCALWRKRYLLKNLITKLKNCKKEKADEKPSKKKKKMAEETAPPQLVCDESYDRFFDIKAILRFTCGIAIVAVIAIIFFFATGGTIDSILSNIENIFLTSEYSLVTQIDYSNTSKILQTVQYFSEANLGICHKADCCYQNRYNCHNDYPKCRLFVVEYGFYSAFNTCFTECKRAGRNHFSGHTAIYKCIGIGFFDFCSHFFNHLFVAGKLNIATKKNISHPKHRIEPINR